LYSEGSREDYKADEKDPETRRALLTRGFGSATEVLFAGSFIPLLVFCMLTWQEHASAATVGLFRLEDRHAAHLTLGMIASMVRMFIVGNLLIALLMGAISAVGFGVLGIPFFWFAGFLSGFLSLVAVSRSISGAPAASVCGHRQSQYGELPLDRFHRTWLA